MQGPYHSEDLLRVKSNLKEEILHNSLSQATYELQVLASVPVKVLRALSVVLGN